MQVRHALKLFMLLATPLASAWAPLSAALKPSRLSSSLLSCSGLVSSGLRSRSVLKSPGGRSAFSAGLGLSSFSKLSLVPVLGVLRGGGAEALKSQHTASSSTSCDASSPQAFIDEVNTGYEAVHRKFEEQFWGTKMALSSGTKLCDGVAPSEYSIGELSRTKKEMEDFLADPGKLEKTREFLKDSSATPEQLKVLKMFEKTFKCYIMESEDAKKLREEATKAEGSLENNRNNLKLGAELPDQGFVELSSVQLRNKMRTDKDEAVRKACYQGLRGIGTFVCDNGFLEIVKLRNKMAKALGYIDYYDYKVTQAEGFNKKRLFEILDTLEEGTRDIMIKARERFEAEKGASALEPWNMGFMMAGDVTAKMDPYFPFEKAVENWGRSFASLGITYKGSSMDLDLLERKGKYSNGFCHWPQPAWVKPDGTWQPAITHFTSLADPKAVSGNTALATLMHEAGHASHFANIKQASPLFAQERAPTSVAYAELQSMFLESLVGDAGWRARYARDRDGKAVPWELVEEDLQSTHPYKVFGLRAMIAVPYFEKALYELPEEKVTAEEVKKLADEVEMKIQGGLSGRPLLSVPHLLADEASCYYHGYVLAEMAVQQTRRYFLKEHGNIVDNPKVGPILEESYWKPGNSELFLDLVEKLTGGPLTGEAWVEALKVPLEEKLSKEKQDYEKMVALPAPGSQEGKVDLDMRVRFVDGDTVIADTKEAGDDFLAACKQFEKYIQEKYLLKA